MHPDFYYLKVTSVNCEVRCLLNGIPVYRLNSEEQMTNLIPVNLFLVGKDNNLVIRIKPLQGEGWVQAAIYTYGQSDIVSTDDEQSAEVYKLASGGPEKEASFSFSNERFDFSHSLTEPPVTTEKEVRAYAARLLDIIGQRNARAYLEEMQPAIADYRLAFSAQQISPGALESQFSGLFSDPGLKVPDARNLRCIPRNDGRIWELRQDDGRPLIFISQKDGSASLEVFVAKINGKFQIIR